MPRNPRASQAGYCYHDLNRGNRRRAIFWPAGDGDLSDYMMWLLTTHVRRYHKHYHTRAASAPSPFRRTITC